MSFIIAMIGSLFVIIIALQMKHELDKQNRFLIKSSYWRFLRRAIYLYEHYKKNPKAKPCVADTLDYNLWLYATKEIELKDLGEY